MMLLPMIIFIYIIFNIIITIAIIIIVIITIIILILIVSTDIIVMILRSNIAKTITMKTLWCISVGNDEALQRVSASGLAYTEGITPP